MVFSSAIFLFVFLPAVFILYRLVPSLKYKNLLLAAASIVFYAFGQLHYVPLFLLSVLINFFSGLLLQRESQKRKLILAISVLLNIGILCYYKYTDFLLRNINDAFSLSLPYRGIELPIGISFFTFQGLSYTIDVYRDKKTGTKDFLKLLLYISFFPQLIAGPIVKYHDISDQIACRHCSAEETAYGISRCYTLQIYYDFSGYSDMAIGMGRMFGFRFRENFDHPYGASSIKEFWRKWHISLSSWFKEYLYIPLGGNRRRRWRTAFNKLIVFFCTGLWHGAEWTFVFWGLGHGLLASLEDLTHIPAKKLSESRMGKAVGKLYTLLAVMLLFVVFRADSLPQAFSMIGHMFSGRVSTYGVYLFRSLLDPAACFVILIAVLFAGRLPEAVKNAVLHAAKDREALLLPVSALFSLVLYGLCIMSLAKGGFNPFIYFQF